MDSRIPESVRPILETYTSLIDEQRPGLISAFYVVGSIALGGFDERFSDIDFVAVLGHPATPTDIEAIRSIHKIVQDAFPKSKLSGSYLQAGDLGKFEREVRPHPYYQDGNFHETGYFEINSVTWWVLKNHGIAIWGTHPEALPFTVDWDLLITRMYENLNSYWKSWTTRPDAFLAMLSDWGIQWTVLGVLRQYYTFQEHSIATKLAAGHYALNRLPQRWHRIVHEAIDIRQGSRCRHYRSRILRLVDAVRFLRFIVQTSNDSRRAAS
jgi:hypothetical protein